MQVSCMSADATILLQHKQWISKVTLRLCRHRQMWAGNSGCSLHPYLSLLQRRREGGWVLWCRTSATSWPSLVAFVTKIVIRSSDSSACQGHRHERTSPASTVVWHYCYRAMYFQCPWSWRRKLKTTFLVMVVIWFVVLDDYYFDSIIKQIHSMKSSLNLCQYSMISSGWYWVFRCPWIAMHYQRPDFPHPHLQFECASMRQNNPSALPADVIRLTHARSSNSTRSTLQSRLSDSRPPSYSKIWAKRIASDVQCKSGALITLQLVGREDIHWLLKTPLE